MKESDKQNQKTLVEIHWQPRYITVDGIMRAHVPLDRDERRRFHRVSEVEGPRWNDKQRRKEERKKEARRGEERKTTHDMNGRGAFNVLSRIYAGWMPSRSTFVPVRVTRRVLFKKIRAWEEWRREGRFIYIYVCTSACFIELRVLEGKAQVASSYLHAPLISSSLSTVGGHSRFRASCSAFTYLLLDERTPWIASSLSNVISASLGLCDVPFSYFVHAALLVAQKRNEVVERL